MDTHRPTMAAAHAALPDPARLPRRLTESQIGLAVEVGPAFRMADEPPYAGRGRLEYTDGAGLRGVIVHVSDGAYQDVEIEAPGGTFWITASRLRVIQPDGTAAPSQGERDFPAYQRTGNFPA